MVSTRAATRPTIAETIESTTNMVALSAGRHAWTVRDVRSASSTWRLSACMKKIGKIDRAAGHSGLRCQSRYCPQCRSSQKYWYRPKVARYRHQNLRKETTWNAVLVASKRILPTSPTGALGGA